MDAVAPERLPSIEKGVWIFYGVFLALLFIEGTIVHFLGLWLSLAIFVVGGALLGLFELRSIKTEQRLRDPILGLGYWLQRRWPVPGYLVNAVVIGGAPGVAVALKKLDHPRKLSLTMVAAVLFAVAWVPLWHWLW